MPRPSAPWWMYLIAASFLVYLSVMTYNDFWGPEPAGISSYDFTQDGIHIKKITPGSALESAGVRDGDLILAVDDQPVSSFIDWAAIRSNLAAGERHRLEIERSTGRLELYLTLQQSHPLQRWKSSDWLIYLLLQGSRMLMLLLAFVIAFSRPHDMVARIGACLMAGLSIGNPLPPYGFFALWRHLPAPVGALLWIALLISFASAPLFFIFFALFPRKLFQARWIWITTCTPMILILPVLLYFSYHLVYQPEHLTSITPLWLLAIIFTATCVYVFAGFGALIFNYRRLDDINQRRRLRVLVVGSMIGLIPTMAWFTILYSPSLQHAIGPTLWDFAAYLAVGLIPVFPLSFAYAILRHQLFDIRIIIRNGLQYAAARGILLYLVPASVAVLVLDLLLHRDQTLGAILAQRGWYYAVVIGVAFLAHSKRQSWMEALDRRFYRERYNAQQLLRETVDEIRAAVSLDAIAPRVIARIEAALHPEFAALMVREARSNSYRPLTIAPASAAVRDLGVDSKLMAVFRALGKPLAVSLTESSWLKQQLPHEETEFLRNSRIELLVPISLSSEGREALLALGSKRSEEPYSSEDQELLSAIAAGLALLLERPSTTAPAKGFEECPKCGTCYDSGVGHCPVEGAMLTSAPMPRLLAARYQLEKRLGQGGMGKVYKALDKALERAVAVKLIRDDLIANSEVAERFRREARSAAAFAHPNLVTVHDFGVDGERRAFLVMELLEGNTLRDVLRAEGKMAPDRVLRILRYVCAAMGAAHQRQLIHRDLKPENIFLVRDGAGETAKVLDFGIAKFLPQGVNVDQDTVDHVDASPSVGSALGLTTPGLLVGTPYYMSPEQLRGGSVQTVWDIWALSIIAFEMLTGAYPFDAKNLSESHRSILAGSFTPVSAKVADAPQAWQSFFDSAFSVDPFRRPKSMAAWFEQLEQSVPTTSR